MIRLVAKAALTWLVFAATSMVSVPAQAGVICSFTGSGTSGTDCLGQAWVLGLGGWGIPGIGQGVIPWAGPETATDFHWTCLTGCNGIDDTSNTVLNVEPFSVSNFWNRSISGGGNTIDFLAASAADHLTTGKLFFVNITVPINSTNFSFEASWTNDLIAVPEPSSLALIGIALLGLGFARRQPNAA